MDLRGLRNQYSTGVKSLFFKVAGGDSATAVGLVLVALFTLLVIAGALRPVGVAEQLGTWQPMLPANSIRRAVVAQYDPDKGLLKLAKDKEEFANVVKAERERKFLERHLKTFNREVRDRSFTSPGTINGPRDCIFAVTLRQGNRGQLVASLQLRDLSVYNLHPNSERREKSLGRIHMRPETVNQPYLTDGYLGFFLEPDDGLNLGGVRRVPLDERGFYSAGRVTLTDGKGLPRAGLTASSDGLSVLVEPSDGYAVFLENNPPITGGVVTVGEAQAIEIGGRFFEAHIEDSNTLAVTRHRGDRAKRVYPMGDLLHIVGPVALDGAHQSLGIEYLFQEYLMGAEERDIPPGEIWLTIHRRLQTELANGLLPLASVSRRGTASAMIMNAKTGAVLAMSSTPNRYDPENRDQILEILRKGSEPYYNHGCFKRHVIGSTTKAFFAFLGMQVMGEQAQSLEFSLNGGETDRLFGHRLYGDSKRRFKMSTGHINFDRYLIKSDNPYQHSLGLLLLAGVTDPASEIPKAWYRKDKKGKLLLEPFRGGENDFMAVGSLGAVCNRLTVDQENPFSQAVKKLFDIQVGSGPHLPDDRDVSIYSEDLLKLAADIMLIRNPDVETPDRILVRRSVTCAPETARMELNEVRNTMDANNVLLGANRNRWTDIKMCEIFSRMMTGKRVKARLVERYRDTLGGGEVIDLEARARIETPPWELPYPDALGEIRRILERVPQRAGRSYPEGTAHLLEPVVKEIQAGLPAFRLYGKTGTIDDGRKGDPDSKLFLGSFGTATLEGEEGELYTFVVYLKNADKEDAHLEFIKAALPNWWSILHQAQ